MFGFILVYILYDNIELTVLTILFNIFYMFYFSFSYSVLHIGTGLMITERNFDFETSFTSLDLRL